MRPRTCECCRCVSAVVLLYQLSADTDINILLCLGTWSHVSEVPLAKIHVFLQMRHIH